MTNPKQEILPVEAFLEELHENIFPYWINKMVDHENDGFYGRRDGHDILDTEHPKGVILNSRILWTFSHAFRHFKELELETMANRAYQYITKYFFDTLNGGVHWMLDYKGKPLETKKYVQGQAFAIYALTEYFLATGKEESLKKAVELFHLVERYSFDQKENGYLEAFDEKWNLLEDICLSEKDVNAKKTMNTHLHILEAYTTLYAASRNSVVEQQLRNLLIIFKEKIINRNFQYDLFFDEHWNVQSRKISFGCDIGGSWLLCEAAKALGDANLLQEIQQLAVKTVDKTITEGLDEDGGLMNEMTRDGYLDSDKHWWPQTEALVGLVNAWEITGDERYLTTARDVWNFILENLIDHKHGEWHWMVDRAGNVNYNTNKAGPWKGPYHNGRALMELHVRLS